MTPLQVDESFLYALEKERFNNTVIQNPNLKQSTVLTPVGFIQGGHYEKRMENLENLLFKGATVYLELKESAEIKAAVLNIKQGLSYLAAREAERHQKEINQAAAKQKRQRAVKQPVRGVIKPEEFVMLTNNVGPGTSYSIARKRLAFAVLYVSGLRVFNLRLYVKVDFISLCPTTSETTSIGVLMSISVINDTRNE